MSTQPLNDIFDGNTRALLTAIRGELEDFNNRAARKIESSEQDVFESEPNFKHGVSFGSVRP